MNTEKALRLRVADLRQTIIGWAEHSAHQAVEFSRWQQKLLDDNRQLQRRVTFLHDLCARHGISNEEIRGHLTHDEWEQLRLTVEAS